MGRPKLSSYALCKISVSCLRQLPSHRSYQVTQILFGEYVEIISKKNKDWFRVKCLWDGCIGWVDPKQFHVLKASEVGLFESCETFSLDHLHGLISESITIPISIGSNLYRCDGLNVKMPFGNFQFSGQILNIDAKKSIDILLPMVARRYIHSPYLYGGRSIMGIDAPGLIQVVYKMLGYNLPRFCAEQAQEGEDIGFFEQSKIGDLAYFEDDNHHLIHAGIILEDNRIIHSWGKVRIDKLDQQGIFDVKQKRYIFKLRTIRRITD